MSMFLVSGLSAAHTIYLAGGNVVLLDKQGKHFSPKKTFGDTSKASRRQLLSQQH